MKKSIFLVCGVISVFATNCLAVSPIVWGTGDTLGAGCYSIQCYNPSYWYVNASPTNRNCAEHTDLCVFIESKETGVASCRTCNPGYELKQSTAGITACSLNESGYGNDGGIGSYQYTYCTKNCTSSTCTPTAWAALRQGYESRTNRTCSATGVNGTCNSSTQYRCAAGYYGTSSNGTSGCNPCPEWSNVYTTSARTTKARGTSSAGATAVTGCSVPAGTYYDATGTFKISSPCPYKN